MLNKFCHQDSVIYHTNVYKIVKNVKIVKTTISNAVP